MKKYLILLLTFFALGSCEQDDTIIDATADKKLPKVDVCHKGKTISISQNALKAHLAHGDFEGKCEDLKTYVPDNDFEQHLIDMGYDDVPDNYVLTSNINTVTNLYIPYDDARLFITDLTGLQDFEALTLLTFGGTINVMVDFSKLTNLKYLGVRELFNSTTLDLTKNPGLTSLAINNWQEIISIDLSKNTALTDVYIERTPLEHIDLSKNIALTDLQIEQCGLLILDLSKNTALINLYVSDNPFTTLDLSNNTVLTDITIFSFDKITSLNLKNGNNKNFSNLNLAIQEADFSLLTCFQVDDAAWSTANWSSNYTYTENCY